MDPSERKWFMGLVVVAQVLGVIAVILMAIWMGSYQGGFGWGYQNPHKFNYHPLFMVIGLIYIYGNAILVYRVFRNENKTLVKVLHMVMQLAAFGFATVALVAVFSAHNDENYPNLYSLHSWIGLVTVIMFAMQFVLGFIFYLFPQLNESLKVWYMSSHRYWGVAIFCTAIVTAFMGIVENTLFKLKNEYSLRTHQAYVVNVTGLFIILFGWLVTYLVHKPEYQREASQSDYTQQLQSE